MECGNCGNKFARAWRVGGHGATRWECCDKCGSVGNVGIPDVYYKGPYWDENLSSQEHPGPKFITSRREKQYWLNKCNLREAGDRVHGATTFDSIYHKHAVKSLERRSK